jgi:hypothetical protein
MNSGENPRGQTKPNVGNTADKEGGRPRKPGPPYRRARSRPALPDREINGIAERGAFEGYCARFGIHARRTNRES